VIEGSKDLLLAWVSERGAGSWSQFTITTEMSSLAIFAPRWICIAPRSAGRRNAGSASATTCKARASPNGTPVSFSASINPSDAINNWQAAS